MVAEERPRPKRRKKNPYSKPKKKKIVLSPAEEAEGAEQREIRKAQRAEEEAARKAIVDKEAMERRLRIEADKRRQMFTRLDAEAQVMVMEIKDERGEQLLDQHRLHLDKFKGSKWHLSSEEETTFASNLLAGNPNTLWTQKFGEDGSNQLIRTKWTKDERWRQTTLWSDLETLSGRRWVGSGLIDAYSDFLTAKIQCPKGKGVRVLASYHLQLFKHRSVKERVSWHPKVGFHVVRQILSNVSNANVSRA